MCGTSGKKADFIAKSPSKLPWRAFPKVLKLLLFAEINRREGIPVSVEKCHYKVCDVSAVPVGCDACKQTMVKNVTPP